MKYLFSMGQSVQRYWAIPLVLMIICAAATIALAHVGAADHSDDQNAPDAVNAFSDWTRWSITFLAVGGVCCGVALVASVSRSISRPVKHLVDVARANSQGTTRRRAIPEAAGDFRDLAEAFNQMMDARQQAEERLQQALDSLECKVQSRTVELWRANKALREESEHRAKAEREFHQAQKMDALGKFAGSIAHDFNNLLTVILGGAERAQQEVHIEHPTVPLMQMVQQAAERASELTRPLLT